MTTQFDWRAITRDTDPQPCPKCRAQAFVTAIEFQQPVGRPSPVRRDTPTRFCVECGYQEA